MATSHSNHTQCMSLFLAWAETIMDVLALVWMNRWRASPSVICFFLPRKIRSFASALILAATRSAVRLSVVRVERMTV